MARKISVLAVLLALAFAPTPAQDARSVLQAAAKAMGTDTLKTMRYSGAGWIAAVGQSFSLTEDWPRFEVTSYTRTIDYGASFSREDAARQQGNYPPRGGGQASILGAPQLTTILSGNHAWNVQGGKPVPQTRPYLDAMPVAELRQLEIVMTPHGFVKAALAGNPTAVSLRIVGPTNAGLTENGGRATIVSFVALGKYRVNGTINEQNLVELTQTWIPNPVYGDMLYEIRNLQYRDFGGVKFPTVLHVHQGDPAFNPAHNSMEIRLTNVEPNVSVAPEPVPDVVRQAVVPPVRVDTQALADGVWLMGGGPANSVAVRFRDFVAVIEAPQNEARSIAVIDAVTALAPNMPIKYVVNTHHHFDHSGGLRTYLAQGTTIVTHQANRDFYQDIMFHPGPRTLQPDRLSMYYPNFTTSRRPAPFETVNQKYVISDGARTLELHPVTGLNHSQGMVMAYLPAEKILVSGDLYSPPAAGAPPAPPNASTLTYRQNIQRLKLDVAQHVPIHGRPGSNDEFLKIVGGKTE